MRSSLASWLTGLVLFAAGAGLLLIVEPFPQRLMIACAMVFLVDALGGRWFGYFGLLGLGAGLLNDPNGTWVLMLPLVLGSLWAALFLRHAEPGWFGVPLSIVGFVLPAVAMLIARSRLDPLLELPLGNQYLLFHGLTGASAVVIATLLALPFKSRQTQRPARVKRTAARP